MQTVCLFYQLENLEMQNCRKSKFSEEELFTPMNLLEIIWFGLGKWWSQLSPGDDIMCWAAWLNDYGNKYGITIKYSLNTMRSNKYDVIY